MRLLLVDNYDSFTFNLAQALASAGAEVEVAFNDRVDARPQALAAFDAIVLSPGPGHPDRTSDVGACPQVLRNVHDGHAVLGVCLGHQLIGRHFGARVVRADRVMHGKVSRLVHDGSSLFADLPRRLEVMRYHSWTLDGDALPAPLVASAWAEDGTLMALRHRHRPWWGLQFHPESVGTPRGTLILHRFLKSAERASRAPHVLSARR